MAIQSSWPEHTLEVGAHATLGPDTNRPVDARRCTVQLATGYLYLDAAASSKTALLGHDSPPISAADRLETQRMLSSLAPGYTCLAMASSFAAAAEFATLFAQSVLGANGHVVELNALDGEPTTGDRVLVAHENETLGRTGHWLASVAWRRAPELVVVGETIALGCPFGAVLTGDGFGASAISGSIFRKAAQAASGEALARVKAAIAAVENQGLLEQGLEVANYLMARLSTIRESCPQIDRIEGTGLSIRVSFTKPLMATQVRRKMCERGVLAGVDAAGRLGINPPLPLRIAEADVITGALRGALLDLPMVSNSACCAACEDGG